MSIAVLPVLDCVLIDMLFMAWCLLVGLQAWAWEGGLAMYSAVSVGLPSGWLIYGLLCCFSGLYCSVLSVLACLLLCRFSVGLCCC